MWQEVLTQRLPVAATQLISAARDGDTATVRRLVNGGHVDVNVTDKKLKMAPGKQCCVCDKKSVDLSSPLGLACSYCGSFFHAKCSSTYSEVVPDVLAIVKKVCVTCPCCEARLEEVEKKLDEFVARVEEKFSDLKDSLLPAQRICSPDVDKAVKDAVSAINNRDHVILYGLPETGSTIKDFETVKDIFDSLGVNDVKAVDVFRLGKVQSDVGVSQSKPRLLKVRLSSSIVRNSLLKKAKLLRDSSKYKSVFIRRSYSFVERSRIKELYNVLRQKKDETGREFFIDRRGNVASWTVKECTTGSSVTSVPASNCNC